MITKSAVACLLLSVCFVVATIATNQTTCTEIPQSELANRFVFLQQKICQVYKTPWSDCEFAANLGVTLMFGIFSSVAILATHAMGSYKSDKETVVVVNWCKSKNKIVVKILFALQRTTPSWNKNWMDKRQALQQQLEEIIETLRQGIIIVEESSNQMLLFDKMLVVQIWSSRLHITCLSEIHSLISLENLIA